MNQTRDLREFSQLEKDIAEAQENFKKGRYTPLEKLLAKDLVKVSELVRLSHRREIYR